MPSHTDHHYRIIAILRSIIDDGRTDEFLESLEQILSDYLINLQRKRKRRKKKVFTMDFLIRDRELRVCFEPTCVHDL